jgi:hypothetical protein
VYEEIRNAYKTVVGKLEEKRPLGGLGEDVRMLSERILNKYGVNVYAGFNWRKMGSSGELL